MSFQVIDASSNMPESTGQLTTGMLTTAPLNDSRETFTSEQNDDYRTAASSSPVSSRGSQSANTPNDSAGSNQAEQTNNENLYPGSWNANDDGPLIIYKGIDIICKYFYGPIAHALIPSPLNTIIDENRMDLHGNSLSIHYKLPVGEFTEGPGGNGIWSKLYVRETLGMDESKIKQVRHYRDLRGVFIYVFDCQQPTQAGLDVAHPTIDQGFAQQLLNDRRQVRTINEPLRNTQRAFNMENQQVPPPAYSANYAGPAQVAGMYGHAHLSPLDAINAAAEQVYMSMYNQSTGSEHLFERDRQMRATYLGEETHTQIPLPPGARVHSARANPYHSYSPRPGNPYYTPPVPGIPATTFGTPPIPNSIPAYRGTIPTTIPSSMPAYRSSIPIPTPVPTNHSAGAGGGSIPQPNPNPSGYFPSASNTSDGITGTYQITRAPVTFTLESLTLRDLYDFVKKVDVYNGTCRHPIEHYQIEKAINPDIINRCAAGTSMPTEEITQMGSKKLLQFLKSQVMPKGTALVLQTFKDADAVQFIKTHDYDLNDHIHRLTYIRDIQAYLKDSERFFKFVTEGMNQQEIFSTLPPMIHKQVRKNGLIEITLSKIPGVDGATEYNYARSIFTDTKNAQYFYHVKLPQTNVLEAYPAFCQNLSILLNNGIDKFHETMNENLKYDPAMRVSLRQISSSINNGAASVRKPGQRPVTQAYYGERRKEIFSTPRLANLNTVDGSSSGDEDTSDNTSNDSGLSDDFDPAYMCLYSVYDMGWKAATSNDEDSKAKALVKFTDALDNGVKYAKKRGEEGYIGTLPTVCIRFLRGSCKVRGCTYSHQWKDYLELAAAIQQDYRRLKETQGPAGNHPPRDKNPPNQPFPQRQPRPQSTTTPKLQQHVEFSPLPVQNAEVDEESEEEEDDYEVESD